jgi:hypothetical protein
MQVAGRAEELGLVKLSSPGGRKAGRSDLVRSVGVLTPLLTPLSAQHPGTTGNLQQGYRLI